MLGNLLKNPDFIGLMSENCRAVLEFLKAQDLEFAIVANTAFTSFDPPLPDELCLKEPYALFVFAGYTLSSLELGREEICFHAGFGPDDFASYVRVDLGAVVQIQVENSAIFLNFSHYQGREEKNRVQNSKNLFLKNNQNLFKK
ncbi:hypothetical protein [Campylobacter sp.]|uniref:hypothetical protein n=1 Tax=Campylobacter sp. TaxID=205 RepID=UPI0026DD2DC9|nr:hypothetical protein [Campylobacter sp.]MDO4673982.1 hypothetical protein [Campylobacter sp.]